ncbi:hypothetical protein POM88_030858 [Heracleum sosnowskyi]|uniref:TF-B3 domain-containing protein n=1 Tax=Heracleum sosnowskyi TaxID=360622 RepID=A0AAD8HZA2_9APIA|nr:hypothetical protein POM88_030858 [Heracleum sosnowskyi]
MSEKKAIKFVCLNFDELYKPGHLFLPLNFYVDHSDDLPEKVFFTMPSGDMWSGAYVKNCTYISGLEEMMRFYDVKPYQFYFVEYNGGGNFKLEIFNTYAVEILYPVRILPRQKPRNGVEKVVKNCSDVEVWKHCSTLCYTAFFNSRASYKLEIVKEHLAGGDVVGVPIDVAYKLGLDARMTWMEVGVPKYKWRIGLNWTEHVVQFDEVWKEFTEDLKLKEGDICVLQYTNHYQKFKVAIFEKSNILNYNLAGPDQGKSIMKFFKIVSEVLEETFHLAFPELFAEKFGSQISEKVTLLMPDRNEIVVNYSGKNNFLYGLKEFVRAYSIAVDFLIFFDFLGNSTFYVSVFDYLGEDVCEDVDDKLHLAEIVGSFCGTAVSIGPCIEPVGDVPCIKHNSLPISVVDLEAVVDLRFEILVMPSHMLTHCHGVDVKSKFSHFRDVWKKKDYITVYDGSRSWEFEIRKRRESKRTTIHQGWIQFRGDLQLNVGDVCKFESIDEDLWKFRVKILRSVVV